MNVDYSFLRSGYIEYTVTNPQAEAREQEAMMIAIIIGIVVGIISFSVIAGIIVHFKNKNKRIEESEQKLEETPKNVYCSNCGAKNIDITGDYCSKCGSKIIK
jgi:phosphotransferase system  glucose/maltose/N-acetylglucosamine-specific IIC component